MNKQKVKQSATIHQYYSILASRDSTGFSFTNPTTTHVHIEPAATRCVHKQEQQPQNNQQTQRQSNQTIQYSPTRLLTNSISLYSAPQQIYSKPNTTNTNTSGMSQEEIRKLYDKAWEWFKAPISFEPNQNAIKM